MPVSENTQLVTIVGSINLDTTFEVDELPAAGETVLSHRRRIAPGGKGANQAVAAAAAGAKVRLIGAIGDDPEGQAALVNLRAWQVDLSDLQVCADTPSGQAHVLVASRDAENLIVVSPGANLSLTTSHVASALQHARSRVLLTQLETPLDVLELCATTEHADWRVLNPAPMHSPELLLPLLTGFNLLVPNRSEVARLSGKAEPRTLDEVAACVASIPFAHPIVVTLGADGAAIFTDRDSEALHLPPPRVDPLDTTGAGDVFCGVLAHGLAAHGILERAVQDAVTSSALSTLQAGAQLAPPNSEPHEALSCQ